MLYLPSALSKITTRLLKNDCFLLLSRTLPVSLSLISAQRCCREWASFSAQFWTSGIHVFLQQPSELSVEERNLLSSSNRFPSCSCCSISVHVLTSSCCCGLQPVYTARKSSTDLEKSRDFVTSHLKLEIYKFRNAGCTVSPLPISSSLSPPLRGLYFSAVSAFFGQFQK